MSPLIFSKEGMLQPYVHLSASSHKGDLTPNSTWLYGDSTWRANTASNEWFMVNIFTDNFSG